MNTENLIHDLRSTKDTEVREQIETLYPADWEMEAIFRKSYQNYLKQTGMPTPISRHKAVYHAIAAAACLLLTVGLGVGVWSKQQKIEIIPPQETQTTTITQTETRTETTAQLTTASTPKSETTTNFMQTSDCVQPSESAAALLTTNFQTETAASVATQTNAAEVGTQQTPPIITSAHTALPQTSVTALIPAQIVPVTSQTSLTADMTTEPCKTNTAETTVQTTALMQATTAVYTQTGAPTEPPPVDYDILPGFAVTEWNNGTTLRVEWLSPVSPSPESVISYHLESERFVLEFAGKIAGQSEYWYDIYDTETGKRVRVRMKSRKTFRQEFSADVELTLTLVNGNPGFQYRNAKQCVLCWDNGCYQCSIYATPGEQEILLPIAEALAPESN